LTGRSYIVDVRVCRYLFRGEDNSFQVSSFCAEGSSVFVGHDASLIVVGKAPKWLALSGEGSAIKETGVSAASLLLFQLF
jgi:hypothetical protein